MKPFAQFIVLLCITLSFSSCQQNIDIQTSGMLDESFFLKRDKQSLYLKVAGNIDSKKILLIIHGGPGGSGLDYRDSFFINQIEKEFAVAYFDQRFGGNSFGNGGETDYQSFQTDIEQTIDLLQQLFGQDQKIYLMAHSWGGFIAPYFLGNSEYRNKVSGWIQVDGAHNYPLNDSLTEVMLANFADSQINAQQNLNHWNNVKDYCAKHNFSDDYSVTAQLNDYAHKSESFIDSIYQPQDKYLVYDPAYSYKHNNFNLFVSGILQIDQATYNTNVNAYLSNISNPVLMIWGKYDFVCPEPLAVDLQNQISSTDQRFELFEHSGHSPMANEPAKFASILVNWINAH